MFCCKCHERTHGRVRHTAVVTLLFLLACMLASCAFLYTAVAWTPDPPQGLGLQGGLQQHINSALMAFVVMRTMAGGFKLIKRAREPLAAA
jgi:hypothetical protein